MKAVHQLARLRLEQAQVAHGGRVFQVGQQRLGPVFSQGIEFAVQGIEHGRRGSRGQSHGRFEAAMRADRRSLQLLFGQREAAPQVSESVLEVRQMLARHQVDGGELLQILEPFIARRVVPYVCPRSHRGAPWHAC